MRRTGPRQPLSVSDDEIPRPSDFKPVHKTDATHGLWGFFPAPFKLLNTLQEDTEFGRSWTVEELRRKDWEDLHKLWWVCVKERNIIATANHERQRSKIGYGENEALEKDAEVRILLHPPCIKALQY